MIDTELRGNGESLAIVDEAFEDFLSTAPDAVNASTKILHRAVRAKLSRPGSYRPYRESGETRLSAPPGSPPALQEGELRESIEIRRARVVREVRVEGSVFTQHVSAAALEFGGQIGAIGRKFWLKPRPAWRPAVDESQAAIEHELAKAKNGKAGGQWRVATSMRRLRTRRQR